MDTTRSTYKVWSLLTLFVMSLVCALQMLGSLFAEERAAASDLKSAGEVIFIKSLEEFDRYLKSGNFIVGYFSSATCGPCKEFHNTYYEMAKEYNDVLFLDICHGTFAGSEALLTKFAICSFPTFIFFDKSGAKKESFTGVNERTKAKIAGEIVMLKEGKPKSNITFAEPRVPQHAAQQPGKLKAQSAPRPQNKPVQQTKSMPKNLPQQQPQPRIQQPVQQQTQSMQPSIAQQSMKVAQNVPQAMSPTLQQTGIVRTNALPQSVPQQAMHTYQSPEGSVAGQSARAQRAMRTNARNNLARNPRVRRLGRRRRQWDLEAEYQ